MQKKKQTSFLKGFSYAGQGINWNLLNERNMLIHALAIIVTTMAGVYFQISFGEWLVLVVFFTIVPAFELANSAVESTCDVLRDRLRLGYQETKLPRDLAAGAVLWAALGAAVAGMMIFLPKIIAIF